MNRQAFSLLTPNNIPKFQSFLLDRKVKELRSKICDYILSSVHSPQDNLGIDIQDIDKKIVDHVKKELKELGWIVTMKYGDTIMFVYTADCIPEEIVFSHEL